MLLKALAQSFLMLTPHYEYPENLGDNTNPILQVNLRCTICCFWSHDGV